MTMVLWGEGLLFLNGVRGVSDNSDNKKLF